MDVWRYFDITHRDHVACNPTSLEKLDAIIGLLDLPPDARALDIACGKGELLLRMGARCSERGAGFEGVGIDVSPHHVEQARAAAARRLPGVSIAIHEMDGASFECAEASFDVASCVGASWIFGGHRGTLQRLRLATKPGGSIVVGEPFFQREPEREYLSFAGLRGDEFGTHAGNVAMGMELGLEPLLALESSRDEWDRYETMQWNAAWRHAQSHPADPDLPELRRRVERSRHEYLTWGRTTLGWALYVFGKR